MPSLLRAFKALLAFVIVGINAGAELPTARLDSIFPAGGRRGTSFDVTVAGADLDDATGLRFSEPGITAQFATPASTKTKVTIASNVPAGIYEARWVGRFGVSNPRIFVVGDTAELITPGTNQSAATAMPISLGTTVNGKVAPGKSDYFRFSARQGQTLVVDCDAPSIDSKMEVALWLSEKSGHEVARLRRESTLRYLVPRDADYVIRVHDFLNRGGDAFFYRLTISLRPHVAYSTPAAANPGTNRMITLHGWNLPGGVVEKDERLGGLPVQAIRVAFNPSNAFENSPRLRAGLGLIGAGVGLDAFTHQVRASNGVSQPIPISITSLPLDAEREPNNLPSQAQVLTPPVDLTGLFRGRDDKDWYQFEAKKGQTWIVEVISQRLGYPADPALVLQRVTRDAKGVEQISDVVEGYDTDPGIGGQDFRTATGDPSLRFEVKEDGICRILVRDQSAVPRDDILRPYQLVIRPPTPDFRLIAMPIPTPAVAKDSKELKSWTSVVRKDGVVALRVMAIRMDGFDASISLRAEGLPAGVHCDGARIASDAKFTTLLLHADETATQWTGSLRLIGKAVTSQGERQRECRSATLVWSVGSYETETVRTRVSDDLALAIRPDETQPLILGLGTSPKVEVAPGAKFSLPLSIRRNGEFGANLKIRLVGHSALGAGKEIEVDKAATNAVFEVDLGQTKIPEGDHWLHVETQTSFNIARSVSALAKAEAAKAEAEKGLPITKDGIEKAKAEVVEAKKLIEKAEAEAKATPEKPPAIKPLQEALTEKSKRVETLSHQLETQTQAKVTAEERIKTFAKREFNDVFYSMPVLVRITAPKTAQKGATP